MATIVLRLPEVKREPGDRPRQCKYCGACTLQGWGKTRKPVRDSRMRTVRPHRYQCTECGRTFRHYPKGVTGADQTERLVALAALMWALGLSLRGVSAVLQAFGISLGRTTVARDGKAMGKRARLRLLGKRVRVLGVDGAWLRVGGKTQGVMVAVDLGEERPVSIAMIEESDSREVQSWLSELFNELGVEVLVTDDMRTYPPIVETAQVEHQICKFHMRRWVGKGLRDAERKLGPEWHDLIDEIHQITDNLPRDGDRRLYEIWEAIRARAPSRGETSSAAYQLKQTVIRLSENWPAYRRCQDDPGVPATNNGTERAIGRLKQRSRTVRGWKTEAGISSMYYLLTAI